jgi:DNA adenine methylase
MIEPFLKWPGGKRWLAGYHRALFPRNYASYFEPFLGGGAVFFSLNPVKAHLSDTNTELIDTYKCIVTDYRSIESGLARCQKRHSSEFYYKMRGHNPSCAIERAIRFIYLNRTCFNGMYRVNQEGAFNVPIGSKETVVFPSGYLEQVAQRLRNARIRVVDFESALSKAGKNDFIFVDPPYTVAHNNNGFVKYNAKLFSWPDQTRLATAVKAASKRGSMVMISNANHKSVRELYDGFGSHHSVTRSSSLASDPASRGKAVELLIVNYSLQGAF